MPELIPLHLCNSIKQYQHNYPYLNKLLKKKQKLLQHLKSELRKIKIKLKVVEKIEKVKLVLVLVLLMMEKISANSFTGGGKNSMLRTRIIATRYGKLQGVILPMDQHKYLKPVEAYLGVPYATPPTGTNR